MAATPSHVQLTPAEAYFVLSRILSWADGEQQEAEKDALTTLRLTERLDLDIYDKLDHLGEDEESLFALATDALKDAPIESRARACAWMLMTAMVASVGAVTTGEIGWGTTLANVSPEEQVWITRAQRSLRVVESDLEVAFRRIPRIRRID
ncbi:MAG: hypothetical protein KF690_04405 [Bacteroidetes bacterium]|nr:hypothetical protein [Bacteroidota bacterium]